jgi:hypothetical protein
MPTTLNCASVAGGQLISADKLIDLNFDKLSRMKIHLIKLPHNIYIISVHARMAYLACISFVHIFQYIYLNIFLGIYI